MRVYTFALEASWTSADTHHINALRTTVLSFHVHLNEEVVLSAYVNIQQGAVSMGILRPDPDITPGFV